MMNYLHDTMNFIEQVMGYFQWMFADPFDSFWAFVYFVMVVSAWFAVYPIAKLYRGYRITKSKDYLIILIMMSTIAFQMAFFNYFILPHLFTRVWARLYLELTVANVLIISLFLHAIRLRWENPSRYLYGGLSIIFLGKLVFGLWWVFDFSVSFLTWWYLFEPFRFLSGLIIVYCYGTYEKVKIDRQSKEIVTLWMVLGVVFMLSAISSIGQKNGLTGIFWDYGQIIQNAVMFLTWIYIAIRYPEYLLLSKAQIRRACNLYKLVHVSDETKAFKGLGMIRMKKYIESIPSEIFDCGD